MNIALIAGIGIIIVLFLIFTQMLYNTMLPMAQLDGKGPIFKGLLFFVTFILSPAFLVGWIVTIIKSAHKRIKNEKRDEKG